MKNFYAFTMAEILLSLTIIGVVAAITLPSLTGNINERTWNTQRKALYARMSQAISLMPAINGYGTLSEGNESTSAQDTAAETFVTAGLAKVLKINNICDAEHLSDCGITSKITTLGGITITTPKLFSELNSKLIGSYSTATQKVKVIDTKAAAFETANGESIITYYNPYCVGDLQEITFGGSDGYFMQNKICANFIYDLNGNKGPNTVGKDIGFITVMYPSDVHVTSPIPAQKPLSSTYSFTAAFSVCKGMDGDFRLPNSEEVVSLFANKELLKGSSISFNAQYWSGTKIKSPIGLSALVMKTETGQLDDRAYTTPSSVWCVKR